MGELVSVVIPAYNASRFIGAAVASVLDQTYKDVEIVVVDDCSTDGTLLELGKFRDRVRIVRHETNQGAAAARNTGLKVSRGGIVAFLDGDDLWAPGKLDAFVDCFARHPDVLFAFSDFSRFKWSDGSYFALSNSQIFPMIFDVIHRQKYTGRKCFSIPRGDMFELLLRGYPIYPSAVAVRKRIFDAVGPWGGMRTNEDFDFGLRCCRATDFLYIDEILSMIGRHESNVTLDTHRQMEGDILIFDAHLADPSYGAGERGLIRHYRGRRLCALGNSYAEAGKTGKAFGKYFAAMRNGGCFLHSLYRFCYLSAKGLIGPFTSSRTTSR